MKTQFRDPHGILNSLQSVGQHEDVFYTLLEAAESFDTCMIRRSQFLNEDQRGLLMRLATSPLPLRHQVSESVRLEGVYLTIRATVRRFVMCVLFAPQVRLYLRRLFGPRLPDVAPQLELPALLQQYLLYEFS